MSTGPQHSWAWKRRTERYVANPPKHTHESLEADVQKYLDDGNKITYGQGVGAGPVVTRAQAIWRNGYEL